MIYISLLFYIYLVWHSIFPSDTYAPLLEITTAYNSAKSSIGHTGISPFCDNGHNLTKHLRLSPRQIFVIVREELDKLEFRLTDVQKQRCMSFTIKGTWKYSRNIFKEETLNTSSAVLHTYHNLYNIKITVQALYSGWIFISF